MNWTIDKTARERAYRQLYRQIRGDIISGKLPRGTKLPSKRLLADELGISIITVEHALALLTDEGCLESRPRSGFYVSFGGLPQQEKRRRPSLSAMQAPPEAPEDFPFALWAKTMRNVLSEYGERILSRVPGTGSPELKSAIADWMARSRGLSLDPERMIIGSGAEYLYSLVAQLLGPGCPVALENPSYEKIRKVYEANGAVCEWLAMGADGILSEELERCRAALLHVTPYHSYPSGVTASAAKKHEYAVWAKKNGSYLAEDDYDSEFAAGSLPAETLISLLPEQVIYINSFSKTLAPAIRTGFMVLPEKLHEKYRQTLDFYSCTVPVFDQIVLAEFIRGGHLERYVNRRRRKQRAGL
ncbi:MAG: PLP-dependent aminotransferase family protein [Lachnospiraceae bacterium]|nr:PLP-dependent aminotransferase family protein [Lachnospiraceae bacterium]